MPYKIIKVKGGYKNKNLSTGKTYSKKPMTKKNVEKQMVILKRFEKKEKKNIY
jgi:hypothetical protein